MPAIVEHWAWAPAAQERPEFFDDTSASKQIAFVRRRNIRALLWTYEPEGLPLIEAIHKATGVPVCPIVPNMAAYARDTRDKGFARAALNRLLNLPPLDIARIALGAAPSAFDVLAKDFATGVCLLAEMELVRFRRFRPAAAFLHNQMADLAMAFDNRKLFERFRRLARGRYGVGAGFVTYNFGHLAPKLSQWGLRPDRIVTPLNPKGYLMYPDRAACEAPFPGFTDCVVACETNAGHTIDAGESIRYLCALGITRSVVPWELD